MRCSGAGAPIFPLLDTRALGADGPETYRVHRCDPEYSMTGLRYPRFVAVAGKIYLRIQVDGEDREIEIGRDQAWNLMLDLSSFMALQERVGMRSDASC